MEVNIDDIPDVFLCPITHQVMEHPFMTAAGHTYEYSAIRRWLDNNDLDPKSNERLPNKSLIPNHSLRSQIRTWFDENKSFESLRDKEVEQPPPAAYQLDPSGLDKILRYSGKVEHRGGASGKRTMANPLPSPLTAFGHEYTFSDSGDVRKITCDNTVTIDMPRHSRYVFAVPDGLIFYDPKATLETRILRGTDVAELCKFSASCTRDNCKRSHPFVCLQGVDCPRKAGKCKYYHPNANSVTLTTSSGRVCKYGVTCTRKGCYHAHPKGTMCVEREKARLWVTHSHTLTPLSTPIELRVEMPDSATCFQMQGEFLFSFQPYLGSWAKNHYKVVSVYRFDLPSNKYQLIGDYSLDKHYCNCAVAAGRYIIFSFWPYEEEAMRTIWSCLRVSRQQEKELRKLTKECEELRKERDAARQEASLARQQAQAAHQKTQAAQQEAQAARQDASSARLETQSWKAMQQRQERELNERLRLRDPIHVYALQEGTSGLCREDWRLVLDYHKGAHDIELGGGRDDLSQPVKFIVDSTVLQFVLMVPKDVDSMKMTLPCSPPVLCQDF